MKELEIIKYDKKSISKDKNLIFSIKELLSLCVFLPTELKLTNIIGNYTSTPHTELLLFKLGKVLVGVAGVKIIKEKLVIKHLAVSPYYRKQGIGHKIIKTLSVKYKAKIIEAETDADALEFYRKTGFTIQDAKSNPLPIPRFLCTLRL
jgi:N-acetylglutamate synthase-like GNAT family acetyltransferase